MKILKSIEKAERYVGGLKFAVIAISIFSVMMIVGTFLESYYGTEFANKALYKTWHFMLIQFLMGLSILFAAFLRMPPKKRLYGFYTIHAGLILLGCGSFITWYAGIDGSITLAPNSPEREVVLSEDIFKIVHRDEGRKVTVQLPSNALKTVLNWEDKGIKLLDYYPFSENEIKWLPPLNPSSLGLSTASFLVYNNNVSQDFTLSLNPEATDYKSTLTMGLLNIHYLPSPLAQCFDKTGKEKLIIWDTKSNECFVPSQRKIQVQKTGEGNRFLAFNHQGTIVSFFPDYSPYPMDKKLELIKSSTLRIFSQNLFEEKPNLFILGKNIAYFDEDKWQVQSFKKVNDELSLPWMDFTLRLLRHEDNLMPTAIPKSVLPVQKNSEVVIGAEKAVRIEVQGKKYWVTTNAPLSLRINGKRVDFYVSKRTLSLPFEFVLSRFKMDTNPGTNNPASYESFVRVFTKNGPMDAHIFMNNPLKLEGFTFYQASYGKDPETNQYFSTLSVNVDQGRPIKYLGSLLLVLGAIWHFYLKRKKNHA